MEREFVEVIRGFGVRGMRVRKLENECEVFVIVEWRSGEGLYSGEELNREGEK